MDSGDEFILVETANKIVCNDAVRVNDNGNGAGLNVEEVDELHTGIPTDRHLAVVPFGVSRTVCNKAGYVYAGLLDVIAATLTRSL